jgi:alkylated DNA repair dioxygenase AlkB
MLIRSHNLQPFLPDSSPLLALFPLVSATTTASGEQGGAVLVCGFDEDEPGEHTDEAEKQR